MKIKSRQIQSLHKKLIDQIEQCLGYRPISASIPPDDQWKQARRNEKIVFSLIPSDLQFDQAIRERGRNCIVFPISKSVNDENYAWGDWREEWRCEEPDTFSLITASWTFYWGSYGNPNKRQLFRANWDGEGAIEAPQPHWHFDATILTEIMPQSKTIERTLSDLLSVNDDLVELPAEEISESSVLQELRLGTLHLGMIWDQTNNHPSCWKNMLTDDVTLLAYWSVVTLQHAQREFERIYVTSY